MSTHSITIVLVEDDDGHASLVERNLRRAGVSNGFFRLRDGQEAIEFFAKADLKSSQYLILLDVKMPRVDGIEVLRRFKEDAELSTIPIIMLTTTDDPREIRRCYELGCNVYITKPVEYEGFVEAIRRLGFFLQVVRVPQNGDGKG